MIFYTICHCHCGQLGCFEHIASGTAIARNGSTIIGKSLTTKEVFNYYHQGHLEIQEMVDNVFYYIGVACVSFINMLEPEKIIIGGGVSNVGEPLFTAIEEYVQKFALSPVGRLTKIEQAGLQQNAGIIGACTLVFNSSLT